MSMSSEQIILEFCNTSLHPELNVNHLVSASVARAVKI